MAQVPGLPEATPATPAGEQQTFGPITLSTRYETSPGKFEIGEFTFRQPTPLDRMAIGRRAAMLAAPARFDDVPYDVAYMLRCTATIEVLGQDPLPKWFDLTSPTVDETLITALVSRFWEDRAKLFRGSGGDGKDAQRGPLVEIVSSVR